MPIRSNVTLYKSWSRGKPSDERAQSTLTIKQTGDSILIQTTRERRGPIEKEGMIPVAGFQTFWDSLSGLGFWKLKDEYGPSKGFEAGDTCGYVSVSADDAREGRASKTVWFIAAQWTLLEFWQVYYLLCSMERFAQSVPDILKDTLDPHGRPAKPPIGD